jgi:glutamine phosphoribosylpyrophosphate amidotransferase
VPDLATVHNGHVTNYHQLRRRYEQRGTTFYTDNDSEVIGVYLRDRLEQGRTLAQAMADSLADLDGSYNYLVGSTEGLGIVRDRHGFKPLMLAETDDFVAVATEEIALRRALAGNYRAVEPPPGTARFYPLGTAEPPGGGPWDHAAPGAAPRVPGPVAADPELRAAVAAGGPVRHA